MAVNSLAGEARRRLNRRTVRGRGATELKFKKALCVPRDLSFARRNSGPGMNGCRRALLAGTAFSSIFVLAMVANSRAVQAQTLVDINTTISGTLNGANAPGYFVTNGSTLTVNGATLQNFTTSGGAGSGGGAGLGGAIFIDSGSAAVLNGVTFSHNTVIGGIGGTVSPTGGALNNGVVNGYFSPTSIGTAGTPPPAFQDNQYIFGDSRGSGVNGGNGSNGGNAVKGVGGSGGNGQFGTPGWSSNQVAQDTVTANQLAVTAAQQGLTAAQTGLAGATAAVAAAAVEIGLAAAGFNLGGPTTQELIPGFVAQEAAAATQEAAAAQALISAQTAVNAANSALAIANQQLSAWNTAANGGSIAFGGNGGNGGAGGNGSYGFGGGGGGKGVVGAAAGTPAASEGDSGSGGAGGAGGFGGGGGAGGFGASATNDANRGASGVGGAGGAAGFGGGVGSIGGIIGDQTASGCGGIQAPHCGLAGGTSSPARGGGGGSGYGGAIFVNNGGALTLTGTGSFGGNGAIGGASLNGGLAGGSAGTDLFMMRGSTVQIAPGAGNVITFNGTIADDSIASIGTPSFPLGANPPVGAGSGLTTYAGLTVFNGHNTYSGETVINGGALGGPLNAANNLSGAPDYATTAGALQAANGVGLPTTSNLKFAGPSQFTGGVLQTSGTFDRWINPSPNPYGNGNPGGVQWSGSGGFAAINAPLTVSLSNNGPLTWGANGFVPFGSSLLFGSANSNSAVTFTNAIDITGGSLGLGTAASILVANNGNVSGSSATMSGVISGNGDLSIGGGGFNGTLNLSAVNTYTGSTAINSGMLALTATGSIPNSPVVISNGTLDISQTTAGASVATLAGSGNVALGSKTLTVTNGSTTFYGSLVDGGIGGGTAGNLTIAGGTQTLGGLNLYSGNTTINGGATLALSGAGTIFNSAGVVDNGTLDISQLTSGALIKTLSGSGNVVLGSQFLNITAGAAGPAGTTAAGIFSGNIGGLGGLVILGGHQRLTGTNTYQGGTLLFPDARLTTNATAALPAGGVILLVSSGGGIASLFTGSMQVVGPLDVVDSQPMAQLTLLPGDVLKGVGGVNANIVNQGGTISPGDGPGTLFINAPISYSSASTYEVTIDGAATSIGCLNLAGCAGTYSSTVVTGAGNTFTAGGTIAPVLRGIGAPANNNYSPAAGTSFTVVQTTGGVLGSFAALTQPATGLAAGTRFDALYHANDITLYVTPANYQNLSAFGTKLSANETQVGGAINALRGTAGVRVKPTMTAGLGNLFMQQPRNLPGVMDSLSGEANTVAGHGAFQMTGQFLGLMVDPTTTGRAIGGVPLANGYASEYQEGLATKAEAAFGSVLRAPPAEQRFGAWGSAFGGYNKTNGDASGTGTHDVTARAYGAAVGLDYRFTPDTVAGFALAGGGTDWSLSQGLGTGKSDAFQAGLFAKTHFGATYVAGAATAANHWMKTDRTAFGGDHVNASFNAQSYGGRLEAGYRYPVRGVAVTPYAAVQAQTFRMPSYSETDLSGGAFALSYGAATTTDVRGEFGARFDGLMALSNGMPLALRARAAWAHDWVNNPTMTASFLAAPPGSGASFTVTGTSPAHDSALLSAGAELRITQSLSLGANFDGEFASGSQTYSGKATVRVSW